MSAVDLPLGYTSGKAATKVVNEVNAKFQPKELKDTEVMYLHAHGPGLIHTKGKAVRKLEDMKGLKLRGHGTSAKVVKALGGTPVWEYPPHQEEFMPDTVTEGGLDPRDIANPASAYFFLSDDAQVEISGTGKKRMKCLSCGHLFTGEVYGRCPECFSSHTEEVTDEKDHGYW